MRQLSVLDLSERYWYVSDEVYILLPALYLTTTTNKPQNPPPPHKFNLSSLLFWAFDQESLFGILINQKGLYNQKTKREKNRKEERNLEW